MQSFYLILGALALERSGFYSFLALYALYRQAMGDTVEAASAAVGWVMASVYGLTFLGGLAGRRWGFKAAGAVGLAGLVVAYGLLARQIEPILSIGVLAVAIGLFKPTPVVMIGQITADLSQKERDIAMIRLYVAVNVGGFLGPFVAGMLVGSWSLAFGLSAAMSAASLVLWLFVKSRVSVDELIAKATTSSFKDAKIASPTDWRAMAVIGCMCVAAVTFYAGYNAFFGSVEHWIKDGVNRTVGGKEIPVPWFNAENGALIVIQGLLWPSLMAGWKISTRFVLAIATSLLSFCLLIAWNGHHIAPAWVAFFVVALQTAAEIALSPLGLSRIQSLSPLGMTGIMTAMWYLSTSAGGALSGVLSFVGLACLLVFGLVMTLTMRWFGVLDYDPTTDTEMSDAGKSTLARSPGETRIMSSTEL